jgi:RNA polymerase sigma factor (sigma-70 family)
MHLPNRPTNADMMSDDALLVRISALARRSAVGTVLLVGLDGQDVVDDVAHDVVLDCLIKIRAGQWDVRPRSLRSYVRNAVRQRAVDYLRRCEHRAERDAEHAREMREGTHAWMSPDLISEDRELSAFHAQTLASLPEACRRTYFMIREGRMSYTDAASQLGVSRSAVSANVVRAQRAFRARLLERGIVAPRAAKGSTCRTVSHISYEPKKKA